MGTLNIRIPADTFEPAMYSIPELMFLADHLTETPAVAFYKGVPEGVSQPHIAELLGRLTEITQLAKAHDVQWCGYETLQESIARYLAWQARSAEIFKRRGPANPSMFTWDENGTATKYAIGADAGSLVRSEILDTGERKPFRVHITLTAQDALKATMTDVMPWVKRVAEADKAKDEVSIKPAGKVSYLVCSVCQHQERFDPLRSMTKVAAQGRMSNHLKRVPTDVTRHRALQLKAFKR